MSPAWQHFEQDFLNANTWPQRKDGFSPDLLDALSPEERTRAVAVLMKKLDGRDDWPVRAMAYLKVSESIPILRALIRTVEFPAMRAVIATAIYELSGDESMEMEVASVAAAREREWMYRLDAIHCLGRFKTKSAHKILCELTHDPDPLVSHNARLAGGRSE